jgi:hypothetical protein
MWEIADPQIRQVNLDFTPQPFRASQLMSDGTVLVNAIELVDWEAAATQVLICEACGTVGCNSGGWVSLRSAGPVILVLPAFAEFIQDHKKYDEYAPPYYIRQKGIPYMDADPYECLRSKHKDFPAGDRLSKLSMREAVLALQSDAPAHVFGTPPEAFGYIDDLIVGTTEGETAEQIDRLSRIARDHYDDHTVVSIRPLSEDETPISLFFDFAEFTEWKPLVRGGTSYRLMLNSRFVVVPAGVG